MMTFLLFDLRGYLGSLMKGVAFADLRDNAITGVFGFVLLFLFLFSILSAEYHGRC